MTEILSVKNETSLPCLEDRIPSDTEGPSPFPTQVQASDKGVSGHNNVQLSYFVVPKETGVGSIWQSRPVADPFTHSPALL